MLRTTTRTEYTYRRRLGATAAPFTAGAAAVSGGISAGVQLAQAALASWTQNMRRNNDASSATTAIVNGLEIQLKNLKAAYFNLAAPTCGDQRAALNAFDDAMVWLQSPAACGFLGFGAAGDRCISERVFPGARFSWVDAIRTPIAEDPRPGACNTQASVLLPSLYTGQYEPVTFQTADPAAPTGEQFTTGAREAAGFDPKILYFAAAGLLLLLMVKK